MGTTNETAALTADEIAALASRAERPDKQMSCADWLLWYVLRDIYADYRIGKANKDVCASRKRDALDVWEREHEREARNSALVDRVVELWKRVEEAADMYRKDRTLENADLVMIAIYGTALAMEPKTTNQTETNQSDVGGDTAEKV